MLTQQQHVDFQQWGLLRLPAAVDAADAEQMCDRVWDFMASKHRIRRDDPATWTVERPRKFRALTRSGALDQIGSAPIRAALSELMPTRQRMQGQPLVTFPVPGQSWDVPTAAWHADWLPSCHGPDNLPGITVFVFLAPVRARGGGTAVLAGSHHLVARHIAADGKTHSRDVEVALAKQYDWMHDLWDKGFRGDRGQRFMRDGAVLDGVPVRVVELTGEPGDAYLMRGDTLHTATPNCLDTPRMMALQLLANG